jgi:hypothetical protein
MTATCRRSSICFELALDLNERIVHLGPFYDFFETRTAKPRLLLFLESLRSFDMLMMAWRSIQNGMTISELVNRLAGLKKTRAKRLNIRSAVLIDPDNELNTRSRHLDQQSTPL